MKFEKKKKEELETIINFDYKESIVNIYTNRNSTINKFIKFLGKPKRIVRGVDGKIYSCEWDVSFDDRPLIRKVLSIKNLIFQKKK